jgi:hypothetical protein
VELQRKKEEKKKYYHEFRTMAPGENERPPKLGAREDRVNEQASHEKI